MFIDGNLDYPPIHCRLTTPSWRNIVDQFTDILHFKIVEDYKMLPQYLGDLISANPDISINLNTDVHDRFLRCCVIFPIARHVCTLTLPILIADCFFYRTPSFYGVVFNLCSKTPYGETILLMFAILPLENTRHLVWTIQCCVRGGISFRFPLFTDQGPLISTAKVLQSDNQTIEIGEGLEEARTLKIFLNIMIHTIHFTRGAHFHSAQSMTGGANLIQKEIQAASRAHTEIIFDEILSMLLEICVADKDHNKDMPDAIDVALYILKVDPSHW